MKRNFLISILILAAACLAGQDRFTDSRDGNIYKVITVNGVTWMAENLKFKDTAGGLLFDNNAANLPYYGLLYDWKTALNSCPSGWHLPSGSEFRNLSNNLDHGDSWLGAVSNPVSFNIQLGGMQDNEGTFSEMDESAYYWTSTEYDKSNAEYFSFLIISNNHIIDISRKEDVTEIPGTEKEFRYSVRCVRN